MVGTQWEAPGKGSTLGELVNAFGAAPKRWRYRLPELFGVDWHGRRTNLTLTHSSGVGALKPYDYDRYESKSLEVS
jgi:hypothetical protein